MSSKRRILWVLAPLVVFGDAFGTTDSGAMLAAVRPAPIEVQIRHAVAEVPTAPAVPPPAPAPELRRYASLVEAASRAHGVEAALVHAVIFAESSYDPNAVSVQGASGLMQLMPETARLHGVRDVFNPAENIRGGVRHLKKLLVLFDGNVELAIAAYNAGENAVIRAGNRIPPYPQTETYVPRVIGHYRRLLSPGIRR